MDLLAAHLQKGIPKGNLLERHMMGSTNGGTPLSSYYVTFTTLTDDTPETVYFNDSEALYDAIANNSDVSKEGIKTMKVVNPINTHDTMFYMFSGYSNLESIDLTSFDTTGVTDMYAMFANASSLVSLDLSGFDTSLVTTTDGMFQNCSSMADLNLTGLDFSGVTYTAYMFDGCERLSTEITISNPDTTSYSNMFRNAATETGTEITVHYADGCLALATAMVATKSDTSNVVL